MTGILLRWETGRPSRAGSVISLRSYYEFLAKRLFFEYEPAKLSTTNPRRDFLKRLERWLACFDDDAHALSAFKSIQYIFFAGSAEFEELYRCAYENNICRWLMEVKAIGLFEAKQDQKLQAAVRETWICPATDSLKIGSFLHINRLKGHDVRSDWRGHSVVGDDEKIKQYIARKKITRLVIVEDFVGSGRQFWTALEYAMKVFSQEILGVPLICCSSGLRYIKLELEKSGRNNVRLSPALVIPDNCMVGVERHDGEPELFPKLRETMAHGYAKMGIKVNGDQYGHGSLGNLTILYSNCPNNTPPIFGLDAGGKWSPIFQRISR